MAANKRLLDTTVEALEAASFRTPKKQRTTTQAAATPSRVLRMTLCRKLRMIPARMRRTPHKAAAPKTPRVFRTPKTTRMLKTPSRRILQSPSLQEEPVAPFTPRPLHPSPPSPLADPRDWLRRLVWWPSGTNRLRMCQVMD